MKFSKYYPLKIMSAMYAILEGILVRSDAEVHPLPSSILLQILMSLLKLGVITVLLSDSLVSGYTAAAAFTIFITQIKFVFGLQARDPTGFFTTPKVRVLYVIIM